MFLKNVQRKTNILYCAQHKFTTYLKVYDIITQGNFYSVTYNSRNIRRLKFYIGGLWKKIIKVSWILNDKESTRNVTFWHTPRWSHFLLLSIIVHVLYSGITSSRLGSVITWLCRTYYLCVYVYFVHLSLMHTLKSSCNLYQDKTD
jgi:hypothetical protein